MIGDAPMMMPPLAGMIEQDDDSLGLSNDRGHLLSDRSRAFNSQ